MVFFFSIKYFPIAFRFKLAAAASWPRHNCCPSLQVFIFFSCALNKKRAAFNQPRALAAFGRSKLASFRFNQFEFAVA